MVILLCNPQLRAKEQQKVKQKWQKNITFTVKGFHFYRASLNPNECGCLNCFHEENNSYDILSIKICTLDSKIISYLMMEISGITKFIIQRGAIVTVKVTGKHCRRSPLV